MNITELAMFLVVMAAGIIALGAFIFVCHLILSFLKLAVPVSEARSKEGFEMDAAVHKPQMGEKPRAVGARARG